MTIVALAGVLAFVLTSLIVGTRLIWLSQQSYRLPALSIGLALFLNGGLGYVLLTASLAMPDAVGSWMPWLQTSGLLCVSAGAAALWLFTWRTFRPGETWAACLVAGAVAILVLSFAMLAIDGAFAEPIVRSGAWFWPGFVVRGLSLAWAGGESIRYYRLMKRREALDLAEPLVTNRFLLWGIGAMAGATATVFSGTMIALDLGAGSQLDAGLRFMTALLGLTAAIAIGLAFFPPAVYRRRFVKAS